jgi:hypothetical protein
VETRPLVASDALDATFIRAIAVDRNGAVYAADARDMRILAFDAEGRHLRTFGTKGAGPGEFRAIDDIALIGDTLFVLDGTQRRLTLFSVDGKHISTRPWPGSLRQARLISGGGSFFARATTISPPPPNAGRGNASLKASLQYHVLDGTPEPPSIPGLGAISEEPGGTDCATKGRIAIVGAPFPTRGLRAAATNTGEFAIAERGAYAIRVVKPATGAPLMTITRPFPALPVTDSIWASEAPRYLKVMKDDPTASCNPPIVRPASRPVINALISDERGLFWLEVTTAAGFALNIIDPALSTVEQAPMPQRDVRVPMVARGNRMYYVALDADDVQSINVIIRQ